MQEKIKSTSMLFFQISQLLVAGDQIAVVEMN
jgi:hypothetical protein